MFGGFFIAASLSAFDCAPSDNLGRSNRLVILSVVEETRRESYFFLIT